MRDMSSLAIPVPVSATSITARPPSLRELTDSQPPVGMASRALRIRFTNTCCSLPSTPCTMVGAGDSSRRMRMLDVRS